MAKARRRQSKDLARPGIKPHRVDTFKVFTDPRFEDKLTDRVGLYLNLPAKVVCLDEKSHLHALDLQPSLPLVKGRGATLTHDYKRYATWFASLRVLTGEVTERCFDQHRHEEFLKVVDADVPKRQEIHRALDNYSTDKHDTVQRWLRTHTRLLAHFSPTSSFWLKHVERWFRALEAKDPAPRQLQLGDKTDRHDRGLPTDTQDRAVPVRLDCHRRIHRRQGHPSTPKARGVVNP